MIEKEDSMGKRLKKFVYKLFFDKKSGKIEGINTQKLCEDRCKQCALFQREGGNFQATPQAPNVTALVVADLDRQLPEYKDKPEHIVECEAEMQIFEKE
jgi:hypothetical protein